MELETYAELKPRQSSVCCGKERTLALLPLSAALWSVMRCSVSSLAPVALARSIASTIVYDRSSFACLVGASAFCFVFDTRNIRATSRF